VIIAGEHIFLLKTEKPLKKAGMKANKIQLARIRAKKYYNPPNPMVFNMPFSMREYSEILANNPKT
jgi:hypothetical protein